MSKMLDYKIALTGAWYEVRVRKDGAVMMDAKISPEMLAMIIKEVR